MSKSYFGTPDKITYKGPETDDALAYRYYDKNRKVLGKTMEEHLRPAICYWHNFAWPGSDVFGEGTFQRPWHAGGSPLDQAEHKLDVAFEMFTKLDLPYFTFHDRDIAPEMGNLKETNAALDHIVEKMAKKMQDTGRKVLWGTANLFGHRRYMSGAATNHNPEVFAHAAAQVKKAMDITKQLDGANYVLWGGREGYETLLNTNMKREVDNLGRFMQLVVDYKNKIGFKGLLLIEPKPKEPTAHQYDFDSANVFAFLQKYGLEKEFKVNIEANHAILAGHSFQHEVVYALANNIFGSLDINRGDFLLGWDTDQFPNDIADTAMMLFHLINGGGFTTGGMNFDAKLRRPSIDPNDMLYAHIGGMDCLARGLIIAEKMINDGKLAKIITDRYAGWDGELGKKIYDKGTTLESLAKLVSEKNLDPKPVSARQEWIENLVSTYI